MQTRRKVVYVGCNAGGGCSAPWGMSKWSPPATSSTTCPTKTECWSTSALARSEVQGVMPFEVLIDGHRPAKSSAPPTSSASRKFQNCWEYPEFSRSLSAVDAVKFGVQAFYGGDPENYRLPSVRSVPSWGRTSGCRVGRVRQRRRQLGDVQKFRGFHQNGDPRVREHGRRGHPRNGRA